METILYIAVSLLLIWGIWLIVRSWIT